MPFLYFKMQDHSSNTSSFSNLEFLIIFFHCFAVIVCVFWCFFRKISFACSSAQFSHSVDGTEKFPLSNSVLNGNFSCVITQLKEARGCYVKIRLEMWKIFWFTLGAVRMWKILLLGKRVRREFVWDSVKSLWATFEMDFQRILF